MERRLDRSIENKERVTPEVMMSIIKDYSMVVDLTRGLEVQITSALQIFDMVTAR
jgi:hypothetical protein